MEPVCRPLLRISGLELWQACRAVEGVAADSFWQSEYKTSRCSSADLPNIKQTLIATQLLYYCAQTTIKISLLLMYYRTFSVNKRFRIALYAAGTVTIMWFLACFWDTIFQCTPIEASWNHSIPTAKCQNIENAALGTGISNLILDVLFIALPIPVIWDLKLPKKIKVSLTGIFLLGIL